MQYCYQHNSEDEASCQNETIEGSTYFPYCSNECHQKYADTIEVNKQIDLNKSRNAAEIGHKNLLSKGYILCKQGSYYSYILKDWLPKFIQAGVLVLKHGMYIPVRDKINELTELDGQYQTFLRNRNYQRQLINEEMKSLGATETKKLNG